MVNDMSLLIKGFIVGIAKVIPGVSGAMIAISFSLYDRLIDSVVNFFTKPKENFKFLFVFGLGVFLAIVCFSNVISYFINNYYVMTMMFFIGLITSSTYTYSVNIEYSFKNVLIILSVIFLMVYLSIGNVNNMYILSDGIIDYLMYFLCGVIEVFSSIVPGISGTAILMMMGMYENTLMLFSNVLNISFVIDNIILYLSYGLGIIVSFILFSLGISYLIKKHRNLFDVIVLGLSIASILLLIIMTFRNGFMIMDIIMGIILFFFGILISFLAPKS